MKINEKPEINPVGRAEESAAVSPTQSRAVQDRVTVQHSQNVAQALATTRASGTADRTAKLKAIETAVRQGEYHPNAQDIADSIMEQGELDARLRAMLQG